MKRLALLQYYRRKKRQKLLHEAINVLHTTKKKKKQKKYYNLQPDGVTKQPPEAPLRYRPLKKRMSEGSVKQRS